MARSNLAYKPSRQEQSYRPEPVPLRRPALRTIEGQGRGVATQTQQQPWLRTFVVMCAAVIMVLATVSVGRIGITNATVQMMQAAESTQTAIDQARAYGLELEVNYSVANNPTRIQDRAASLGVLPSAQTETLEARSGFSVETLRQMQAASEEARAAELASISEAQANSEAQASEADSASSDQTAVNNETTSADSVPNIQTEVTNSSHSE